MSDDESVAMNGDRIGRLERLFERLDERGKGWLDKDDATRLMEFSSEGDRRLREDVGGRINDFRVEVRDAFKHAEREYTASLFKSSTESEGRIQAMINAAINSAIAERPTKGWHPIATYGGTSVAISVIWIVAYMLGFKPPGFS